MDLNLPVGRKIRGDLESRSKNKTSCQAEFMNKGRKNGLGHEFGGERRCKLR